MLSGPLDPADAAPGVDLFDLLRRWSVRLVLAMVVGAVLGLGAVQALPSSYEVTVELLVGPAIADADVLEGASDLARTYGEVVESRGAIGVAAEAAGLAPSEVNVHAFSGRQSSTLEITVRTSRAESTATAARALIDWLSQVVEDASVATSPATGGVQLEEANLTDLASLYPSGSVVVVLDDGAGDVVDSSLGEPIGAAAGALVAGLLLGSFALDREHRRASWRIDPRRGRDLGPLRVAPRRSSSWPGEGLAIARDRRADLDVQRVVAHALAQADDVAPVIFVTAAPSVVDSLGSVLLQLTRATGSPATIVDPSGLVAPMLGTVGSLRGITHEVMVDREPIARLIVPRRSVAVGIRTPDDARAYCRALEPAASTVFVSLPVSDRHPTWSYWAAGADCGILLASVVDDIEAVHDLAGRIRAVQPRFTGVARVERRWLRGRSRRARVGVPRRAHAGAHDGDEGPVEVDG